MFFQQILNYNRNKISQLIVPGMNGKKVLKKILEETVEQGLISIIKTQVLVLAVIVDGVVFLLLLIILSPDLSILRIWPVWKRPVIFLLIGNIPIIVKVKIPKWIY